MDFHPLWEGCSEGGGAREGCVDGQGTVHPTVDIRCTVYMNMDLIDTRPGLSLASLQRPIGS